MATTVYSAQEYGYTLPDNVYPIKNQQNFKNEHNYDNYNNNNYNNNTRARVEGAITAEQETSAQVAMHGDFGQTYLDSIGRPMPNVVRREIDEMIRRGISSALIHAVLEYTAGAPRPSWAYARAVILRNFARGINDDTEFLESVGLNA